MEEDQEARHVCNCKVCGKSFPCGRSLGGHMRSHPGSFPASDHPKTGDKLNKKKLPNNPDGESEGEIGYGAKENPNRIRKSTETNGEDTYLDQEKSCKECGKNFQSFKALFGHMKCHSISRRTSEEDFQNQVMDSQSDNEAANSICRRKRSNRKKRSCAADTKNSSSDLAVAVCEINDQLEKEDVALSLILLSMNRGSANYAVVKSSSGSSEFVEAKRDYHNDHLCKKVQLESPQVPAQGLNSEVAKKDLAIQCNDISKNRSKRKSADDHNLANRPSDSVQDYEEKSKFRCTICLKAFPSYQALGGHRASHKKFKSCCANQSDFNIVGVPTEKIEIGATCKNNKQHECPICFRVFASGQALGGHKRSHLITDKPKTVTDSTIFIMQKPITEARHFLDLNMPAPAEEECIELKPWWIKGSHRIENESLLSSL